MPVYKISQFMDLLMVGIFEFQLLLKHIIAMDTSQWNVTF
jgi:hypothetical protein